MYSGGLSLKNMRQPPVDWNGHKMDIMEIILLIAGAIIFILSFLIPDRKEALSGTFGEEEVKELVSRELEAVRNHVDEVVEEAANYAVEKTERSLERLSNEKIMAVNEYSETVLAQINKNHEEAVFLYDMLNHKHESLKGTMAEVTRTVKEAEETMAELGRLSPKPELPAPEEAAEEMRMQPQAFSPEPESVQETKAIGQSGLEESEDDSKIVEQEKNNNEKILALYEEGKDALTIARQLGLGVGEVKLVIDLFQR